MAAPKSNGVLRTKLADMKIGDYIWATCEGSTPKIFYVETYNHQPSDLSEFSEVANAGAISAFSVKFYMIKVRPGLLMATSGILLFATAQQLNSHNLFKGYGWRCPTIEEMRYAAFSDLNGAVTPSSLWAGGEYYLTQELRIVRPSDGLMFTVDFNSSSYGDGVNNTFCPVYEYVDSTKPTNIFY